jgi:methyl-accepting chemotaxis protein
VHDEYLPAPAIRSRWGRLPIKHQLMLGLSALLALLAASVLLAITLVADLGEDQTSIDDRAMPYADAVDRAVLEVEGIADDQRGFLLTGDTTLLAEADGHAAQARRAFASAEAAAEDAGQRASITAARAGFERWLTAVNAEFAAFRAGKRQAALAASMGPDLEMRKTYERSLTDAQTLGTRSLESATTSLATDSSRSVWILLGFLVLALGVGGTIAHWLLRSVALPVFRLVSLLLPER